MIAVNETLPDCAFQLMKDGELITLATKDLFANKKVVLFAVPGAYTPTCSNAHLPGYVVKSEEIYAKGVDAIICLSVNDAFVMDAWGKTQNAENLVMLADGGGDFTKAIGLDVETGVFGGVRSKRYAMIVDDNKVTHLNVEAPKEFKVSDAESVLSLL
jgi:peroxiredoxin